MSGSSAVGDITGGIIGETSQERAARRAGRAQAGAAQQGIEFQKETRDLMRADLEPYRVFGANQIDSANNRLFSDANQINQISQNMSQIQGSGIMKNLMEEINRQTMNNMAARGKLGSGGTLMALRDNTMAQMLPLAAGINDSVNNNIWNAVNMGQSAAAGQANGAMMSGNAISDLMTQKGNAIAARHIGVGNAKAQGHQNAYDIITGGEAAEKAGNALKFFGVA